MQTQHSVPRLLQELASFASTIHSQLLSPAIEWRWKLDAESWSLTEVMCHLRDVEVEVHMMRYEEILNRDNPFLTGVSSDEWASSRGYQSEDGLLARDSFLSARQRSITLLSQLDEISWRREGRHAFFGPTSLQELVNLATQHDQVHLRQIEELLAKSR